MNRIVKTGQTSTDRERRGGKRKRMGPTEGIDLISDLMTIKC